MRITKRSAAAVLTAAALAAGPAAVAAGPVPVPAAPPVSTDAGTGIVTFADRAALLSGLPVLRRLRIRAQALDVLPMALASGTPSQLASVATSGGRYWPEELLEPLSAESVKAVGADVLHRRGFTGKGVTVAVIDTGIDASHPALADHVTHNFVVAGLRTLEDGTPAAFPTDPLVTIVDAGPRSNTDVGGGHGTVVAGVLAGDGTGDPASLGVAPDASVVGYRVGTQSLTTFVAAMDHVLAHPELGVDVVNLSFGSRFTVLDPEAPKHVATKALHDAGVVVAVAAGNGGAKGRAMTLNTLSAAPWVIAAGASTLTGGRADLSSNGLALDGSLAGRLVDGHVRSTGDRLGIYQPSVLAPGVDLTGPCSFTGAAYFPGCNPASGRRSAIEGTSFAAPHIAGISALLLQAAPDLTPGEVKQVLEATAVPTTTRGPAWQDGYGVVSAPRALDLVRSRGRDALLERSHRAAATRLLAKRPWKVATSDLWSLRPPVVSAGGVTPSTVFTLHVPRGTDALTVSIAAYDVTMRARWALDVRDAAGKLVTSTEAVRGVSGFDLVGTALTDLRGGGHAFGKWTLAVVNEASVEDEPFKDGVTMSVHAARLLAKR